LKVTTSKLMVSMVLLAAAMIFIISGCSSAATPAPTTPAASAANSTPTTPATYPNSGLLVSDVWLKAHLTDSNLTIIDTRTDASYGGGHIQGAINLGPGLFDTTNAAGDNTVLKSGPEVATIFGQNGVSNNSTIVIYSDGNDTNSGRVFWDLEYLGQKDMHILDGGFGKWKSDGNAAVTDKTAKAAATYTPAVNAATLATKADVLNSLGKSSYVIVDSRNAADWVVKRIPGSINILMGDYLNSDQTVKSFSDLTAFLAAKGITPDKKVITHCYIGYRSAQAYFIFRLMGYSVSNYDGSTTEWFADPSLPTAPN
jgi:thiosulfate/3-mercaptopyruvate sulfurtransferase